MRGKQAELAAIERAYRYHTTTCGAANGACFMPFCRCECHPAARAVISEAVSRG